MRNIIFRGQSVDTKKWVYGYFLQFDRKKKSYILPSMINFSLEQFVEVDPITIGEYIGRDDQTGKNIFEGDIIKVKDYYDEKGYHEYVVGNVVFENGEWHVEGNINSDFAAFYYDAEIEIIGNVYDNAESLDIN